MNTNTQRNFSAGEITPSVYPRADMTKYTTGAKTVRNLMVMRHGGLTNRPGTIFGAEAKYSDRIAVLVPFTNAAGTKFILEVGDGYIRFFKNFQPIYDVTKTITGITKGATTTITATGISLYPFDQVTFSGIVGMTELNGKTFTVYSVSGSTFTIVPTTGGTALNSSSFGTYVSGGVAKRIYEVPIQHTAATVPEIKFSPLGNTLTLTHRNYAPLDLKYISDTSWTATDAVFLPSVQAPTPTTITGATGGPNDQVYVITSVSALTGEESFASGEIFVLAAADPTPAAPITISWTSTEGISEFNVYKRVNRVYGFIGIAAPNPGSGGSGPKNGSFKDVGKIPDTLDTPPTRYAPFTPPSNILYSNYDPAADPFSIEYFPANVTYFQQRRAFVNTTKEPDGVYLSQIGKYYNFTSRAPIQDDDSIHFRLAGQGRNEIRHAVNLGSLILLTEDGEWVIGQDGSGITPTNISARQHSYNGSSKVSPIVFGGNMLYIQANGSVVRDFGFDYQVDGYRGNDLTVFSAHLFDKHTFSSWAYQQTPHSVIWMVRDDGVLIGLTYIKEQDILAWHRHDTDGFVEYVTSITEGNESVVYMIVRRTINGQTKRNIERMANRQADLIDLVLMDSAATYDGRNLTATVVTISGGTLWDDSENLTMTASSAIFASSDVGSEIHIGDDIRFAIQSFTSSTVVVGRVTSTLPVASRNAATAAWSFARKTMKGLWHLEGKKVSVFADGYVVASPNNAAYATVTVTSGQITLASAYAVIHVGLPVTADLETLNVEIPQAETMSNKKINTSSVTTHLSETRGLWVGSEEPSGTNPLDGLREIKPRSDEGYDTANNLMNGPKEINVGGNWQNAGRVFIRQVDPLPCSILAVSPSGLFPLKGP